MAADIEKVSLQLARVNDLLAMGASYFREEHAVQTLLDLMDQELAKAVRILDGDEQATETTPQLQEQQT